MLEDTQPCTNADTYCFNVIFDKKLEVKNSGRATYQQAGAALRMPWPQAPSASGTATHPAPRASAVHL